MLSSHYLTSQPCTETWNICTLQTLFPDGHIMKS
jgi:hypothetical protein